MKLYFREMGFICLMIFFYWLGEKTNYLDVVEMTLIAYLYLYLIDVESGKE